MATFPKRSLFPVALAAAALALAPSALRAAASDDSTKAPSFSDKTSEAISKLTPLITAKNWDASIALLTSLIPSVPADSYDMAVIEKTLGGIYWQGKEDPKSAIEPWETTIRIALQHPNYYPASEITQLYQYLANIYLQLASDTKLKDPTLKKTYLDKALEDYNLFLKGTAKPQSDDLSRYASLIYYRAVIDPEHIDKAMLQRAIDAANRGLLADIHPKQNLYQVLQSAYALDGQLENAAKYTELLLKQHPNSKEMWPQLWLFYYNLAADNDKDAQKYKAFLARAINTVERAQGLGFMKTQRDYQNLVSMYQNAGQFGKATDILHAGLRSGAIEDTKTNWKNLALFYKEIGDDYTAINVLKEADTHYQDTGDFDQQISDIYQEMSNTKEAYNSIKDAVRKGNLSQHPGFAYYQLAFLSYEQGLYDECLKACDDGLKYKDAEKELKNLKEGVQKLLAQQAAQKEALKEIRQQ